MSKLNPWDSEATFPGSAARGRPRPPSPASPDRRLAAWWAWWPGNGSLAHFRFRPLPAAGADRIRRIHPWRARRCARRGSRRSAGAPARPCWCSSPRFASGWCRCSGPRSSAGGAADPPPRIVRPWVAPARREWAWPAWGDCPGSPRRWT